MNKYTLCFVFLLSMNPTDNSYQNLGLEKLDIEKEIQKTKEKLELLEAIKNAPLIEPLSQEEVDELTRCQFPCELQR